MSTAAIAEEIRAEARTASRAGQHDSLMGIAARVEALPATTALPDPSALRLLYDQWSDAAETRSADEHDAAVALADALRDYMRQTDPEGEW